jgi:triosephosphate isomerase
MKPIIVTNFKTYLESTGNNAVNLAKIHNDVAHKAKTEIIIAVQPTDIHAISSKVTIPVFAQHVDAIVPDKNTGYILPEAVKQAGAVGTLLNHAEHRVPFDKLIVTLKRCHELGLKVIVCTDSLHEVEKLKTMPPYAIAFEDPILIGTGQSITKSKQETVKQFAALLKGTTIIPLCGAGISTKEDVEEALKLGTRGILAASGIVKAKDQEKVLMDLCLQ